MTLDTYLNIGISIFVLVLTCIGLLTSRYNSWKYRIAIIVIALFISISIIFQGLRIQGTAKQTLAHNAELQHKIDGLSNSNTQQLEMIYDLRNSNAEQTELLNDIAQRVYPDLPSSEALEKLKFDISNIESRTEVLEQETQKTVFHISNYSQKMLADGTFETKFKLIPNGNNVIPMLTIAWQTENNAVIMEYKVEGQTLPGISYPLPSEDKTAHSIEYQGSMRPGIVNVTIITDKNPGQINITIDPSQENEEN